MLIRKCFIIFCLCFFAYGDENGATNFASSSENAPNALNSSENAPSASAKNENLAQNTENLSQNIQILDTNAQNSNENTGKIESKNAKNSSENASTKNENIEKIESENTEKAENTQTLQTPQNSQQTQDDDNDFGDFAEFEAEFDTLKVNDPLSGYNKMMTQFNVALYTYALRPIAKGYEFVMPEFARVGIKNFFSYIAMPIRFAGNVLQFKFKEAGTELKRFGVNTIFGFFGLIDAASKGGIPIHHADFGLVLAHWGVGGGFHFVLPVLGPSNLRDTLSIPVNWYASPITYVATYDTSAWINWLSVGITSFGIINSVSFETQTLDTIYNNTPNLYPFLRDAYEKRRTEMAK